MWDCSPELTMYRHQHTVKVNHIPLSVNQSTITSMFKKYGPCEVHMKQPYGSEEQHAFVNYISFTEAQTAASRLDGITLSGVKIEVYVQGARRRSSAYTGDNTVKIENLTKSVGEKTLEEVFGFYGDVKISSIKLNSPASSPFSYAYVNYCSEDDAQRAVDELNGIKIDGSSLSVKIHRPQRPRSPISPFPPDKQNFPFSTRCQNQPSSHSSYARFQIPPSTSLPHSRPALRFEPSSNQSQPIPVYPEEPPSNTVKVTIQGNLTSADLEAIFNRFGTITSKPNVIPGSPNFAFINFKSPCEAMAAVSLNGQLIRGVKVGVKLKKRSGNQAGTGSSIDYWQIDCEPLLVKIMTLSAQSEYKSQIQGIESSLQVKIMPMKNGNGFTISGSEEKLQQANSKLELVISEAREKLGDDLFTLSCHFIPAIANQEVVKQVTKIENKYHVEFLVCSDSAQEPVCLSLFSHFVCTQLKKHTPATISCISKYLGTTTTASPQTEHQTGTNIEEESVWEWQDDDGSFKPFSAEHCAIFNCNFHDNPTSTFPCSISTRLGVTGYLINFSTMTQTNAMTTNSRQIRRQPTAMKGASAMWLYTDDNKKLVHYTKQQSREIENVWTTGESTLSLRIDGELYRLDFSNMKQTKVLTQCKRNIIRRSSPPCSRTINFQVRGLKENLEHAIKDFRKEFQSSVAKVSISLPPDIKGTFHSSLLKLTNTYLVSASVCDDTIHIEGTEGYLDKVEIKVQEEKLLFERMCLTQRPSGTSHGATRPDNWGPQLERSALVSVARGTSEWTDVEKLVHASLPLARMQTLQRIQNEWLWEKYSFSKERMNEQNNGVVNEKRLFHGTSSTPPEKIFKSRQGFDFRFCSSGMWGTGTYFAVNAKYSDNYAYQSTSAKQLIVAKVLTGETYQCGPDRNLTKPPVKRQSKLFVDELYDSVSGNTSGSDIFIIYDHEKAYPEYLITYTTTSSFFF